MADNVTLNSGVGGATAGADDIGGVHYQRVKVIVGADGINDGDVASTNPMPIDGTVDVASSALPTGAATSAKQDTIIGHVDGIEGLLTTIDTDTGDVVTAVQVMDDWDEADRAKVNIVVGQAGVTAGAGAVAANTPRVTHASDDPAVTALQIIDDWDETDRAKVNPIVGQAGVQGASGTVSANTQRVVLATDVALPTGTNSIGAVTQATASNFNAQVVGDIAHDAVDSGNPVKIGGKVLAAHASVPTEAAVLDRVDAWFEPSGALVTSNAESVRSAATAVWQVASAQTPVNSTVEIDCSRMGNAMIWWLPITGTITGGAFRFEGSPDGGTTWAQLSGQCFDFTMASYDFAGETATQIGGGTVPNGWRIPSQGMDKIRVKLTTVLSGTAGSWSNEFGASSAGGAETASIRIYLRSTAVSGQAHVVARQGDGDRLRVGSNTRRLTDTVENAVSTTDSCVLDCEGFTSAPALGIGGTWGGTLVIEQSADGSSYTTATGFEISTFAIGNTGLGTITANGMWMLTSFAGQRYIKVRGANITSGTANVAATSNGFAGNLWTLSGGDKSHDAPDAVSMPIKIGGKALTALPTAVAASDRVNALFDVYGRLVTRPYDQFHISHQPAAATQATIARASAGAGIKNVCTNLTVSLSSSAAPTVGIVTFNLRDGASGAGTVLWTTKLSLPAVAGQAIALNVPNLWLEGTAATAMTLETSGAPAANVTASVSWSGTITQ